MPHANLIAFKDLLDTLSVNIPADVRRVCLVTFTDDEAAYAALLRAVAANADNLLAQLAKITRDSGAILSAFYATHNRELDPGSGTGTPDGPAWLASVALSLIGDVMPTIGNALRLRVPAIGRYIVAPEHAIRLPINATAHDAAALGVALDLPTTVDALRARLDGIQYLDRNMRQDERRSFERRHPGYRR